MKYRILEKTNGFGKTRYIPQYRKFFFWFDFTHIITLPCILVGVTTDFGFLKDARNHIQDDIKKNTKPLIKVIPFP